MKEHVVQSGQSLLDVAVIVYGSVGVGLGWLIQDNGLSGPVDRIYEGQILLFRDEAIDQHKKNFLQDYQTIATIKDPDMAEGIGFWRVNDYVVGFTPLVFDPAPYVLYNDILPRIVIKLNLQGSFYTKIQHATTGQVIADGQYGYLENAAYTHSFFAETPGEYEIQVENLVANLTVI